MDLNEQEQQLNRQMNSIELNTQSNIKSNTTKKLNTSAQEFIPSWLPSNSSTIQNNNNQYNEQYNDDDYDQEYDQEYDQGYDEEYNECSKGYDANGQGEGDQNINTKPQLTKPQLKEMEEVKATLPVASKVAHLKPLKTTASKPQVKQVVAKTKIVADVIHTDVVKEIVDEEMDESDLEEMDKKENCNILFMGHVDAGKSTMGGHILLLTGMVDKRTMEKYEVEAKELGRESWYLSWALDLNQEERDRGKTTEYGRGAFETENKRFTIIDAPGHRNYIPSMIEGASQADFAILVISARKGEFETGFERDGQTREHVLLAKTAGVKMIIMVINKMDDPTVLWAQSRYDEIVGKMMPFLKNSGYSKDLIKVLPISGYAGTNIKDSIDPLICKWWIGEPLLTLLDGLKLQRNHSGPFLMPIADKAKDMGTIAMGKIESGVVKKGSTVLIMPNKKLAEVLAVYQDELEVSTAYNGDNVRLRLKGCDEDDVQPGFVLCTPSKPVHATQTFKAQIQIVEYASIMCAGYTAIMHAHTTREEIVISELLHKVERKSRRLSRKAPLFMRQGDVCVVRITVGRMVCLESYEAYPQLGRFTIRDENRTVAVGKVLSLIDDQ